MKNNFFSYDKYYLRDKNVKQATPTERISDRFHTDVNCDYQIVSKIDRSASITWISSFA